MFTMLNSGLPENNAEPKRVEYCPIHHNFTRGPCDRCIDDGIEDFSMRRAQKELDKLQKENSTLRKALEECSQDMNQCTGLLKKCQPLIKD
jgi:hypothetical protein